MVAEGLQQAVQQSSPTPLFFLSSLKKRIFPFGNHFARIVFFSTSHTQLIFSEV